MKKLLIFFINIFAILCLCFLTDFFSMHIPNSSYNRATLKQTFNLYHNFIRRDISKKAIDDELINTLNLRRIENPNSKLKPILIFGCSFAYGSDIEENQTLSYKLGEGTKRPIYNRAQGGLGVQHMLYQLREPRFYELIPEPEYILYVFFNGHYSRMLAPVCSFCPICYTAFYEKDRKGFFREKKKNFINSKIIFPHTFFNDILFPFLQRQTGYQEKLDKLLYDYLLESKKEAKKHWKNVKFMIFFFDDTYKRETMKNLEKDGFILVSREDYKIDPYETKYMNTLHKDHPCELFWDTVTPVIIEKINSNSK